MIKILSLIVGIGLTASSNESRDFSFNVGFLKKLLGTETELILGILDQVAYQQQQLEVLSNEELYSSELEDVLSTANHHLLTAEKTIEVLTDLESLWPKVDDYVKKARNEISLDNVTSLEGRCLSENAYDYKYAVFDDTAQRLCNGMIPLPAYVEKNLKCRYVDHGNPFLKIAPFKQEDVYLDPYIVIYHNVLTNDEVDMLQEETYLKLQPATVESEDEEGSYESKIRVSKNAWLFEEYYPHVISINRRAEHMTNLDLGSSEVLQIGYYEPGGYFNEHVDFDQIEESATSNFGMGNRIGTLMFYLSDVQNGGKTIFTKLNVTLTPKKGNAVFWYNILPNGDLDYYTIHAGCRVVSGVKWVANKWFHELGQEFRRPCKLKYSYDEVRSDISRYQDYDKY